MNLKLARRHVLLTGGIKGIGLTCAEGFLREGARSSLIFQSEENLKIAAAKLFTNFHPEQSQIGVFPADLQDTAQAMRGKRLPSDGLNTHVWQATMNAKLFMYVHMIDFVVKKIG